MQPGKTVFFEMEDWGIELLKTRGLADQVDTYREPLHVKSWQCFPDAEAVSVFIYSEVTRDVIDALPNLRW